MAERLRKVGLRSALQTLGLISLGLYFHYWLLLHVSGFKSPGSALACMLLTRSLLAHPYLHVNIFQVRPTTRRLGCKAERSAGCLTARRTEGCVGDRPPGEGPLLGHAMTLSHLTQTLGCRRDPGLSSVPLCFHLCEDAQVK